VPGFATPPIRITIIWVGPGVAVQVELVAAFITEGRVRVRARVRVKVRVTSAKRNSEA